MPIYTYECDECEHIIEVMQSIKDDSQPQCDKCNGLTTKIITPGNFHLKGRGWAADGYKTTPNNAPEESTTKD